MSRLPALPYTPAVHGETRHAHFRDNGWGIKEHQHFVPSEIHEHDGLRSVQLGWSVYRWAYMRARLFDLAAASVTIGICLAFLTAAFVLAVER